ncbi:MAG: alpha/beta fold hydrolase [Stenotrophobium sp.]
MDSAAPLGWRAGTADANGLAIAWEEAGPAQGEPLLLVMGLGGQLIQWPEALCSDLVARGFRVIRFDNRDIGLSGDANRGLHIHLQRDFLRAHLGMKIHANYTLHDMAKDAVELMDALGITRFHIAGASMGGMIAQITAARHPERVKSLTSIMSTTNSPRLPGPKLPILLRMSGIGIRDRSREAMIRRSAETFRLIGSPGYPTPHDTRLANATRAYDRAFRPGGLLRQTHAILATGSFETLLPAIKAPTQIIHGLADPLVRPAAGQRCARLIGGARLELIPGMGHDFPAELLPNWSKLIAANAARAAL